MIIKIIFLCLLILVLFAIWNDESDDPDPDQIYERWKSENNIENL